MRARQLPVEPRMEVRSNLVTPVQHTVVSGGPELTEVSPCEGIAIAQDLFESVLRERLQEVAPGTLRTGMEVQSATWGADGVRTTLLDRIRGDSIDLDSRYLAAADGWRRRRRSASGSAGPGPRGPARCTTARGLPCGQPNCSNRFG